MKRDARSLAKTTQNDVLWIDTLLYFLLNQRIHHFATILHASAIIVSLEVPGGEVEPGVLQSTLTTPQRNLMSCELENGRINTCGTNKSSGWQRSREIGGIGDHVER